MRERHLHSLKTFAAFGILISSSLLLLACPPATDQVRVRNLSVGAAKLTFVFLRPEKVNDFRALQNMISGAVTLSEPKREAFIPDANDLQTARTGYIATLPPRHTLWLRSYKTGRYRDNGLPETLKPDKGAEHRTFTRDELKKRFRTHRSRDLYC